MTPKEKAKDLVDKFRNYVDIDDPNGILDAESCILYNAKQCALIAVELIISETYKYFSDRKSYWQQVKQEINKL